MKTLQINENDAIKLFKTASPDLKKILVDTFGAAFFSGKITDRIKTYEDACTELGIVPMDEDHAKAMLSLDEINYIKVKTVTQALNEGWVPDWTNGNENKWTPYFRLSGGAFVFHVTNYDYSFATAGDGSRLCFKSDELATYAGKQFIEIYKGFMF